MFFRPGLTGVLLCTNILTTSLGIIRYRKNDESGARDYTLLGEFATMDDVLDSTCIEGKPFAEIIMDADTELLGQD